MKRFGFPVRSKRSTLTKAFRKIQRSILTKAFRKIQRSILTKSFRIQKLQTQYIVIASRKIQKNQSNESFSKYIMLKSTITPVLRVLDGLEVARSTKKMIELFDVRRFYERWNCQGRPSTSADARLIQHLLGVSSGCFLHLSSFIHEFNVLDIFKSQ